MFFSAAVRKPLYILGKGPEDRYCLSPPLPPLFRENFLEQMVIVNVIIPCDIYLFLIV